MNENTRRRNNRCDVMLGWMADSTNGVGVLTKSMVVCSVYVTLEHG